MLAGTGRMGTANVILQIIAHIEEFEKDGWTCAKQTGTYTVTRLDGSKRDVDRDGLIAILKTEPLAVSPLACPKCGHIGGQIQAQENGDNFICINGCGPYMAVIPEDS